MNQLERIYRIHELLTHCRHPVPMRRFTGELECSRNTITRDFEYLRNFLQAPLVYVQERNGYIYDPSQPVFELPGFWLNSSELYALLVCEQLLEKAQPGLMTARLAPFKRRIRDLLQKSGSQIEQIENRLHIQTLYSRHVDDAVFARCAEATLNTRQLFFDYHGRGQNDTRHRRVSPQQLVHYRHSWYLLALCHDAEALRLFALDRMTALELQDAPATRLDDAELQHFTSAGFGIFSGQAIATAHLVFDAHTARWAADERWHDNQRGWWEGDCFHLQLPYANSTELVMEILRHGEGVTVVSPPELRDQVTAKIKKMYEKYCSSGQ